MPKLKILRWDPVIIDGNTFPYPMIYIKPDEKFVEYAKLNKYAVTVEISDTGTIYDGKTMVGTIDSSAYYPNSRPNFFDATGYYTITLAGHWYEYPLKNNGFATIRGANGPDKIVPQPEKPFVAPKPVSVIEGYRNAPPIPQGLNYPQIIAIFVGILIVFLALFKHTL